MAKVVTQYREVLEDARARFDRLTQRAAIGPLHTLYDNALQELDRKLSRAKSGTMTAAQLQLLKLQATIAVNNLQNQMAAQVGAASHQAQVESLRSLAHNVRDMERFKGAAVAMPIEEASQFHGLIAGRRTSLLRAHESSMQNYGVNTVNSIEQALALGISVGESGRDLTDRVLNTFDGERWAAERIARTEVAWAYNATAVDAVKAAREELPESHAALERALLRRLHPAR